MKLPKCLNKLALLTLIVLTTAVLAFFISDIMITTIPLLTAFYSPVQQEDYFWQPEAMKDLKTYFLRLPLHGSYSFVYNYGGQRCLYYRETIEDVYHQRRYFFASAVPIYLAGERIQCIEAESLVLLRWRFFYDLLNIILIAGSILVFILAIVLFILTVFCSCSKVQRGEMKPVRVNVTKVPDYQYV